MLKAKLFNISLVVAMLAVAILPATVAASTALPDYQPVDVGPELRTWEPVLERIAPESEEGAAVTAALAPEDYPCYVETRRWLALNDY
ncbi:MAG TPA: hypothetical protein VK880_12170, partial [Anaerolineales bacterium]|nr:hypothetical protein [Anaerolineales bacterium]